jgi:hypothetical protein
LNRGDLCAQRRRAQAAQRGCDVAFFEQTEHSSATLV